MMGLQGRVRALGPGHPRQAAHIGRVLEWISTNGGKGKFGMEAVAFSIKQRGFICFKTLRGTTDLCPFSPLPSNGTERPGGHVPLFWKMSLQAARFWNCSEQAPPTV